MRRHIPWFVAALLFAAVMVPVMRAQEKTDPTLLRATQAELRAAVAEEKLASIAHQQASDKSMAAFRAACEVAKIPVEKCEPNLADWSVHAKVEAPKPESEPAKK